MKIHKIKVFNILSADATLKSLLEATDNDPRIYPLTTEQLEVFPCITYATLNGAFRTVPRKTLDIIIELHIYSKSSVSAVEDIAAEVNNLLNYYIDVDPTIVYMKQILDEDMLEDDRELHHKVVRYQLWGRNEVAEEE